MGQTALREMHTMSPLKHLLRDPRFDFGGSSVFPDEAANAADWDNRGLNSRHRDSHRGCIAMDTPYCTGLGVLPGKHPSFLARRPRKVRIKGG